MRQDVLVSKDGADVRCRGSSQDKHLSIANKPVSKEAFPLLTFRIRLVFIERCRCRTNAFRLLSFHNASSSDTFQSITNAPCHAGWVEV